MSTRTLQPFELHPSASAAEDGQATIQDESKRITSGTRFLASLLLTVPILLLSSGLRVYVGMADSTAGWFALLLASLLFGYGGYPILAGSADELRKLRPGRMTLLATSLTAGWIATAILAPGRGDLTFARELAIVLDLIWLSEWAASSVYAAVAPALATPSLANQRSQFAALLVSLLALGAGAVTVAYWLVRGPSWQSAIERALAVLMAASPQALALSAPLVVSVSFALAAQSGLLIRDLTAFDRARQLRHVVFSKTGILTTGRFEVTDVLPLAGLDAIGMIRIAAAIEAPSPHPIGVAILRRAQQLGLDLPRTSDFRSLGGRGVEARVEGRLFQVAGPGTLREFGIMAAHPDLDRFATEGKTVVFLLNGRNVVGAFALEESVRPESAQAVRELQQLGLRCVMLTGDARGVAARISRQLRLNDFHAELSPDEKVAWISGLQERGGRVAMIGDARQDTAALAQADLGIAPATDGACIAACVLLPRNDLRDVASLVRMAQVDHRRWLQTLGWAAGYNLIALPLAAGVAAPLGIRFSPITATVLMSLCTAVLAWHARRPVKNPA